MTPTKLLGPDQIDALGMTILSLVRELWVVKDRQMVMEAVLQEHGLMDALKTYQPKPDLSALIAEERERFVASIMTTLWQTEPTKE